MSEFLKRTWAQIDLDAIEHNYRAIRGSLSGGCRLMAVVKADAYGHGDVLVAQTLQTAGADWFGVSNLEEAIRLRQAGITRPILILSYTPPEEAARLASFDITQTVISEEYARALQREASRAGVTVTIHIKLDTGMSRVGFFYHDAQADAAVVDAVAQVCGLENLNAQGIFTHFACADEQTGEAVTRRQYALFLQAVEALSLRGIAFEIRHCCNSAATLRFADMHLDMVRPGLILYGLFPSAFLNRRLPLKAAMSLKTVVSLVKEVPPHTAVSYGGTYETTETTRVATVPIGYADGYPRALSNHAHMLVAGQKAPLIGRVCMDQSLLDVTAIPTVADGMTVTVFGDDGTVSLPVEEMAAWSGSINYETVCLIGKRVPRIFYRNGIMAGKQNYLE